MSSEKIRGVAPKNAFLNMEFSTEHDFMHFCNQSRQQPEAKYIQYELPESEINQSSKAAAKTSKASTPISATNIITVTTKLERADEATLD